MKIQVMDQSRSQYTGFWLVCKYCQRAFRDKLELFCHQVNEHPEYREELNNQRTTNTPSAPCNTHEVIYSDPRSTIDVKRSHTNYIQSSPQHASASWYPQSSGTSQTHAESQNYYATPVEYYVVVPNQSQTHGNTASSVSHPSVQQQVMNIPVAVTNQQFMHSTSHSACHVEESQINNVVPIRSDLGHDWTKIGAETSETDPSTLPSASKDDVDYFCWKCKVKFGNATAYISHSGSCFPPASSDQFVNEMPANSSECSQPGLTRKRGKKNQPQSVSDGGVVTGIEENSIEVTKRRRSSVHPERPAPPVTKSRKKHASTVHVATQPNQTHLAKPSDMIGMNASSPGPKSTRRSDENLTCGNCGVKFTSKEKLLLHLQDCKSKKNPYESYQYKCIKCSESFDIYLNYKRHIAIHTGEVRYS